MKLKVLFLLTLVSMLSLSVNAQRGVRIGYIDTEYILENVPEYSEATSQLESKVNKWKSEIEGKLSAIEQKRKELNNEKALLTKELIEEREEDLFFEEKEVLEYQQKRFGPQGDLIIQKKQLMQPIQDQIFQAVQDLAKKKKFDFIFDKSADVVMLYSAERFDVSEQVLRTITRTSKRKQLKSKADKKAAKEEDLTVEVNEGKDERALALEKKKADREKLVEERKKKILEAREAKKKAAADRKAKILEERKKKKEAAANKNTPPAPGATIEAGEEDAKTSEGTEAKTDEPKTREQLLEEKKQKKLADRAARKKALEDRKKKILEDRKKAKEEKEGETDDN